MKFANYLLAICILGLTAIFSSAQTETSTEGAPVEQLNLALQDLSTLVEVEVTVSNVNYRWRGERFPDTSLGCPQPGMSYVQIIMPGYQFLIEYIGTVYDYRVSEDGTIINLCSMVAAEEATLDPLSTPTATITATSTQRTECDGMVTILEGDSLMSIAERCDTTAGAVIDANVSLQTRTDFLAAGDVLLIPSQNTSSDIVSSSSNHGVAAIFPTSGAAGTEVSLIVNGMASNAELNIGIGSTTSDYSIIDTVHADEDGTVSLQITIPATAVTGDRWVIIVTDSENNSQSVSQPFKVR